MEKMILGIVLLAGAAWLMWRGLLFLRLLMAPVRKAIAPYDRAAVAHLDATLERSGMGKVAEFSRRVQAGIERAADEGQARIDSRRKQ